VVKKGKTVVLTAGEMRRLLDSKHQPDGAALANDPALHFFMEFRAGDVQLVCNHSLLHDRTAFEDWPDPRRKRHLLRLWMVPTEARPLPAVFAERYGSVTPGDRGGIPAPGPLTIPWDPDE
jgi:hypothetical protein